MTRVLVLFMITVYSHEASPNATKTSKSLVYHICLMRTSRYIRREQQVHLKHRHILRTNIQLLIHPVVTVTTESAESCLDSSMPINAFLHFLHNYTHLYSNSGSIFLYRCQISPATVTNYSLFIPMFSSTDLVMSDNMFNLILTILLLYFVVKLQMCMYL